MQDFFTPNGFTLAERTDAHSAAPGQIFFLTEKFLKQYYPLSKLPPEKYDEVANFATKLQNDSEARALMWYLYTAYCLKNQYAFPEILEPFGIEESGKVYLLLLFALIPFYEERAVREGFPIRYARDAADRIGSTAVFYAQKYNGRLGILAKSLPFLLNFKNRPCFRIGRFDFEMNPFCDALPEIYACGDKITALCLDGWMFDTRGERTVDESQAIQKTRLIRNNGSITGTPIDMNNGYAEQDEVTLDLNKWQKIAGEGDWTIHYHIPGGGGMTPEACSEAFTQAVEFFAAYFPDKPVKIIWSNSWFFNPVYKEYMPESNIAKLSRSGYLFPVASSGKDGLFFVFGRDDDDFDTYECKTSLQKALMRCQREHGFLRRTGWFMPIK